MITKRDKYFIDLAFRQAIGSEKAGGSRHGAVLVIKNRVVSFGTNQQKSHPFQAEYGKKPEAINLHAETDAIKNALRMIDINDLRRGTLYLARAKHAKQYGPLVKAGAKPCVGCMRAITTHGLKRVVYTTDEGTVTYFTRKS